MKKTPNDYAIMNVLCEALGMKPFKNRMGIVEPGFYCYQNLHAVIDLSACAENEIAILKTALEQLSKNCDNSYSDAIERNKIGL